MGRLMSVTSSVQALVSHSLGDGTYNWQVFAVPKDVQNIGRYLAGRGYTVKQIIERLENEQHQEHSVRIRKPKASKVPQRDNGWENLQAAWTRHS
jgi:hypothetical protein